MYNENYAFLQMQVAFRINSKQTGIPSSMQKHNIKPGEGVAQRLKGQTGQIRSNVSEEKVEFSSNTVILPNPICSLNVFSNNLKIS